MTGIIFSHSDQVTIITLTFPEGKDKALILVEIF